MVSVVMVTGSASGYIPQAVGAANTDATSTALRTRFMARPPAARSRVHVIANQRFVLHVGRVR